MADEIRADMESLGAVRKKLSVTVPSEEVDREFQKVYRDIQKKAVMPGFRRGHVPMKVIRQMYAQDVKNDVAQEVVSRAYHEAIKKAELDPVCNPEIKDLNIAEGQALTFSAEFEVKPHIDLPEYKGVNVDVPVEEVTGEDVAKVLEDLRHKVAAVNSVAEERALQEGDIAVIDFEGTCEGKPIPGGSGAEFPLEVGSKTFIPGFEDALMGLRVKEEKNFVLDLPADYRQQDLAGKEGRFRVTLKAIKERVLPALDDEFARDVGEYRDLEELRAKVRENLTAVRRREARARMKQKAVDRLVESVNFDLPSSLLEIEEGTVMRDFARRLALRGETPEDARTQMEAVRGDIKQVAAKNVKVSLILGEIAAREGIKIEKADLEAALKEMADRYKKPVAELRREMIKNGTMESLVQVLLEEKVLDFLVDNGENTENNRTEERG